MGGKIIDKVMILWFIKEKFFSIILELLIEHMQAKGFHKKSKIFREFSWQIILNMV